MFDREDEKHPGYLNWDERREIERKTKPYPYTVGEDAKYTLLGIGGLMCLVIAAPLLLIFWVIGLLT